MTAAWPGRKPFVTEDRLQRFQYSRYLPGLVCVHRVKSYLQDLASPSAAVGSDGVRVILV